jgi:SAM-dependent methyltransferase
MAADKHPQDHFSGHAEAYAAYRPHYPEQLYAWLLAQTPGRSAAWDCASGNGQVAARLARDFGQVAASDISARQLAQAPALPNVRYEVCPAEATPFPSGSFDLITVAQALHWFDVEAFYREVRRCGKAGGRIAVWGYASFEAGEDTEALVSEFYHRRVGAYWPPERRHTESRYGTLPFSFEQIPAPSFVMSYRWDLDRLLAYLRTWSSTQAYLRAQGEDPTLELEASLRPLWGQAAREVRFPIFLKLGIIG